ncbi:MAG TPA: glycosyltransferase family 4 protein [Thermoanaerobaculia bacterium]|nr:glycosyltransferase family 4 protein [Thermoanaerobaculia bacterium]
MRITYVLPRPELGGGNKVIFQHARLLQENGAEVTVLCEGPKPDWIAIDAAYVDSTAGFPKLPEQDLVIATYWTTLPVARRLGLGPLAHFCQGYEGGLVHLRPVLQEIEAVYSWRLPTLTVAPHLGELLRERFGRESRVVPPPLDPLFRPALRLGPRRRPWIAIPGIFEAEVKGIPTALAAVRRLRESGVACRVLRFSVLPLSREERSLLEPDRYLCGVPPRDIATVLRACDLLFLPSYPEEGFGLPLLEAMASKVPAVASRIPSTVHLTGGAVPLVPPGDAAAFAEAARELLSSAGAWRRARERGFEAARRFRPEGVAPLLVEAVRWARQLPQDTPLTLASLSLEDAT